MNWALSAAEQLLGLGGRLGSVVVSEFEQLSSALRTWTEVEHKEDGTHSDVTADSIDVDDLTVADLRVGTSIAPVSAATDSVDLGGVAHADRFWTVYAIEGDFEQGIYERGRSVKMGDWQDVPFDAADFTGSLSMTWTVSSPPFVNECSIVGLTATWNMVVSGTIGGTPAIGLQITIPDAMFAFASIGHTTAVGYCTQTGTYIPAYMKVIDSATVGIYKADGTNWAAGSVSLEFQITTRISG